MSEQTMTISKGRVVRVGNRVFWGRGENIGGAPFAGSVYSFEGGKVCVYGYGGILTFKPEELE